MVGVGGSCKKDQKLLAETWYNSDVSLYQLTGKTQTKNQMSTALEYRNIIQWENERYYAKLENSRKSGDFTESAGFLIFL